MTEPKKEEEIKGQRWTPHNPLGVIALFVFLIETVATVSLLGVVDKPFADSLVLFIVLYPTFIAGAFFLILVLKREALYGPMDFKNQDDFMKLLNKVELIKVKQDVAGIVSASAGLDDDDFQLIDKLFDLEGLRATINFGRAFYIRKEFKKSLRVFEHIKSKTGVSRDKDYYKLLANIAYSQIGLNRYDDAIKNLLEVQKIKGGRYFKSSHALSLAYANLKAGYDAECNRLIASVREKGDASDFDLEFFADLYPELKDKIKSLVV